MKSVFLLLTVAIASIATASPYKISDFVRHAEFYNAKISPGGDYLAVTRRIDEQVGLTIIQLSDMSLTGVVSGDRDEKVTRFAWVNDEHLILQMAENRASDSQLKTLGQIYTAKFDGSDTRIVYGFRAGRDRIGSTASWDDGNAYYARVLNMLPDDPESIMIEAIPPGGRDYQLLDPRRSRIERFNVFTRKSSNDITAPLGGCQPEVDRFGNPWFCSGIDTELAYRTFWYGGWDDGWQSLPVQSIALVRADDNGESAVVLARPDEADRIGLYRFHARDQSLELLAEDERYDLLPGQILLADETTPFGIEIGYDATRYHYLDESSDLARWHQALRQTFKGERVRFTSLSTDHSRAIVHVSSGTNPGAFYLYEPGAGQIGFLFAARGWLAAENMTPVRAAQFTSTDGMLIDAFVTGETDAKPRPMIVIPHGGPYAADRLAFSDEAQLLAANGYRVMQLNFRGSTGYGLAFEEAAYGQWGEKVQQDIADAVHWAIENQLTEAGKICIYGASFGGYSALMSAVRYPELYECAATMSGMFDVGIQQWRSDLAASRTGRNFLDRSFNYDEDLAEAQSPINSVDKIRVPVFIAHGTQDHRTPFVQAKALRKVLKKHKVEHEWLVFRNEGHGFYFEDNRAEFFEKLLVFIDESM